MSVLAGREEVERPLASKSTLISVSEGYGEQK